MIKAELIKQSPLRILDKSTHGGVGRGKLGVVAARHGVGKSGFLVHLATDKLMQDRHVIHITFGDSPKHIVGYYEDIFSEISRAKHLEKAMEIHDQLAANRVVMNFNQKAASTAHVIETLKKSIEFAKVMADTIIIDEFDFAHATPEDIQAYHNFAERDMLEIWFSVSLEDEGSDAAKPVPKILEKHMDQVAVLINLRHHKDDGKVHLELVKDHGNPVSDMHLILDTRTLLIAKE